MASKKFAVKCGNFAVLVDLHILSQDPSKETSQFSELKKEAQDVAKLLQRNSSNNQSPHLDGLLKKLWFSYNGLFPQEMDLYCASANQSSALRVFPDRFVVCVSQLAFSHDLLASQKKELCDENRNKKPCCEQIMEQQEHCGNF